MRNKKIVVFINLLLLLLIIFNIVQAAPNTGKTVDDVNNIGNMPTTEIDKYYKEADEGTDPYINITDFNNSVSRITGVILVVLQVASIAGVIYAGVAYMIASPDSKADIKKRLIHLAIGMIIVFGASTVVGLVTGTFKDVFKELI